MTDMPTTAEMREALADWGAAVDSERVPRICGSGVRLAQMLRRIADAQDSILERGQRVAEEYTPAGLPKRAAARARSYGARIIQADGGRYLVAIFPNGSQVRALTRSEARKTRERYPAVVGQQAFMGRIVEVKPGAAGGPPPAQRGDHLADALNRFADSQEG